MYDYMYVYMVDMKFYSKSVSSCASCAAVTTP